MLTFLEFYQTLLQFVNFKLYNTLGVRYPPVVDSRLDEAAAGLASIMQVCFQSILFSSSSVASIPACRASMASKHDPWCIAASI